MFCKQCGKQIDDNSAYCSYCGAGLKGENEQNLPQKVREKRPFMDLVLWHWVSIACSAGILIFSFAEWIKIPFIREYAEGWGVKSKYTTLGLLEVVDQITGTDDSELKWLWFIAVFIVIINVIILYLSGAYIFRSCKADPYDKSNEHIVYGYSSMLAIIILLVICMVIFFILNIIAREMGSWFESDIISFNAPMYIILVLACLNRFLLLPTYSDKHYYEIKSKDNM